MCLSDSDFLWQEKVWFAGDCNRKMAEEFLLKVNKANTFLFCFVFLFLYLFFFTSPVPLPLCPLVLPPGWRLPHPTQLEPEPPAAVHSGRALPAEGLQRSHPLPGGRQGLRPRERGQKERRGLKKKRGSIIYLLGEGRRFSLNVLVVSLGFQQPGWDDFPSQAEPVAPGGQQEPGQAQGVPDPPGTPVNTGDRCSFNVDICCLSDHGWKHKRWSSFNPRQLKTLTTTTPIKSAHSRCVDIWEAFRFEFLCLIIWLINEEMTRLWLSGI